MPSSVRPDLERRPLAERLAALSGAKVEAALTRRVAAPGALEQALGGRWITRQPLRILETATAVPLAHRHGSSALRGWIAESYEGLALVAAESAAAGLDPRKTVFLDTETTGLAGGMGTVAFLIGIAWLEEETFRVEQLFIEDYPHEPLLLERLAERLRRFKVLVTFNGKAYDKDILEARFALHKLTSPFDHLLHLDLLHASRRVWKDSLADCRLRSIEEALLGLRRSGDIAGADIPQAYFDFLLQGELSQMPRILEHNRLDLLSLVALAARLNALYHAGSAAHEKASIARILYSRREIHKALEWFEASLEGPASKELRRTARKHYSLCLKSAGRTQEAAAVWEELTRESRYFDPLPFEELAKYYEHRVKDFGRALEVTQEALRKIASQKSFAALGDPHVEKRFLVRRARLARRARQPARLLP